MFGTFAFVSLLGFLTGYLLRDCISNDDDDHDGRMDPFPGLNSV
jgi:hypothetical protein